LLEAMLRSDENANFDVCALFDSNGDKVLRSMPRKAHHPVLVLNLPANFSWSSAPSKEVWRSDGLGDIRWRFAFNIACFVAAVRFVGRTEGLGGEH